MLARRSRWCLAMSRKLPTSSNVIRTGPSARLAVITRHLSTKPTTPENPRSTLTRNETVLPAKSVKESWEKDLEEEEEEEEEEWEDNEATETETGVEAPQWASEGNYDATLKPPVLFRSELNSRTFVLNKGPVNALDLEMINLLGAQITDWGLSDLCHLIIGTGQGSAFCAGGNVKEVVQHIENGDIYPAQQFFEREFALNYMLADLDVPYVAIMDGITMGGGVGLAIGAPFRVVTEKTDLAMPETLIGFFPDVGSSYWLSKLDGGLGLYLALTGQRVTGRDVFSVGLGTHFVSSHRIPALVERLQQLDHPTFETVDECLEEFYAAPSDVADVESPGTGSSFLAHREAIDEAFKKNNNSIEEIMASLNEMSEKAGPHQAWAAETRAQLLLRSPTSLRVTVEATKRAKSMNYGEALKQDLDIATAYCMGATPDFVTGVTKRLVEKYAEKPEWQPDTLAEISQEEVQAKFFDWSDPEQPELKERSSEVFGDTEEDSVFDPMAFSLISEEMIGQIVRGELTESDDFAPSEAELVELVCERWPKGGQKEKVKDVVARRCKKVEETPTQKEHLRWIWE